MRVGQLATVTGTEISGAIEAIEDKKNGTWVTIGGKKFRDSKVVCDYSTPDTEPVADEEDFITDEEVIANGGTVVYFDGLRIEGEGEIVKPLVCQCGCGMATAKGSIYCQGHDQRHKGQLIRAAVDGDDSAIDILVRKGWRTREDILARRAAIVAKAKRQEEAKKKIKPNRIQPVRVNG